MFRITKQTDYGLVLLTRFAATGEHELLTARDLAGDANLPIPMVGKILKLLAKEGLLVSHRGAKGGYSLARDPRKITVAQVIRALEGPIGITECAADADRGALDACEKTARCPLHGNWQRINETVERSLESITLTDLKRPAGKACRGSGVDMAGFTIGPAI